MHYRTSACLCDDGSICTGTTLQSKQDNQQPYASMPMRTSLGCVPATELPASARQYPSAAFHLPQAAVPLAQQG